MGSDTWRWETISDSAGGTTLSERRFGAVGEQGTIFVLWLFRP